MNTNPKDVFKADYVQFVKNTLPIKIMSSIAAILAIAAVTLQGMFRGCLIENQGDDSDEKPNQSTCDTWQLTASYIIQIVSTILFSVIFLYFISIKIPKLETQG